MHLSIAYVCFTALDLGAAVCKQLRSRRLRADSWPWSAGPHRGSRWVSGNWALKSGPACMECPLGPGRAPAPGELARAERLHSSTGRPDSSATLQTSLRPRLRAKTARRCGAPSPVPDSQTCGFHDSPLLGNLAPSKLRPLRDGGSARPRARAGFGFGATGLTLDERRPLRPRPHELKFRAREEPGLLEKGVSRFPEGTEERRSRGAIFSVGLGRGGEGANSFWAPGIARCPRGRGRSGLPRESLRVEAGAEAAAQGAHGRCPHKGARAAARRQACPAGAEGREPASGTARSARLSPLSCRGAPFGLRGARNTPLSPPPGRSTGAVRLAASPGRPGAGAERFPGARVRPDAPQGAGAHSLRRGGARVRGSGPRAWRAGVPGLKSSRSLLSPPWLRRRRRLAAWSTPAERQLVEAR